MQILMWNLNFNNLSYQMKVKTEIMLTLWKMCLLLGNKETQGVSQKHLAKSQVLCNLLMGVEQCDTWDLFFIEFWPTFVLFFFFGHFLDILLAKQQEVKKKKKAENEPIA